MHSGTHCVHRVHAALGDGATEEGTKQVNTFLAADWSTLDTAQRYIRVLSMFEFLYNT